MPYGACASGDPHSALAGRNALMEGGNAVDAAVAAGLMAAVTLQPMTGIGGGGLMTILMDGEVQVLDFFADLPGKGRQGPRPAPEAVDVPFEDVTERFLIGPSTVAVPGVVAGLWEAHARHGRLPMRDLALMAIEAARNGVRITDAQFRAFALLQGIHARTDETWQLVGDEGGIHPVGRRVARPDLADTLERLVQEGPRVFYEGDLADALVATTDGLLTHEDLATYETIWRPPLRGAYRDAEVFMPGTPCLSGGMLLSALAELDAGPPLPHHLDRDAWRRIIDALQTGEGVRTEAYEERIFEDGYLEGLVAASRSGCTMHCSTIDAEGGAVAYTSSVGEGSGLLVPNAGYTPNNFLGEPDIFPRGPFEPGHRMMTSMCPTLIRKEDARWLSLGSAGSDRIRSAILQVIVNVMDVDAELQEAISRPRVHTRDGTLFIEGYGRTPKQIADLEAYGLPVEATWAPGFFFGGVQGVTRVQGRFEAGADTLRRGGAGYVV